MASLQYSNEIICINKYGIKLFAFYADHTQENSPK